MRLPKAFLLGCILTLAGAPGMAEVSLRCDLQPISRVSWIPNWITVQFAGDLSAAQVIDDAFDQPLPAEVTQRSEMTYAISWLLPELTGREKLRFRAVLNTVNMKMIIQVAGTGDGTLPLRGSGHCRLEPLPSQLGQNVAG